MDNDINAAWYLYYTREPSQEVAHVRIAANCLWNAVTTAKTLAHQCKLGIVGVAPDLGVEEEANS